MKILVCDDDVSTVEVLRKQINYEELGIDTFLCAYNGLEAEEIILSEKPEIVLCDIGMPKEDGMAVLKYIYTNRIDTEFAFLTCYEDFAYAKKALQYGASDYINKPFEIEEIVIAIQNLMTKYTKKHNTANSKNNVVSSVFKEISDGVYPSKEEIIQVLKNNGIEIDVDSKWRIVFSCADMANAIKIRWSTDLLFYGNEEMHQNILLKGNKISATNAYMDNKYIWNITIMPDEDEEDLNEKLEELRQHCIGHMSLDPAILLMDSFSFYELADKVTEAYGIIRRVRTNKGRIYLQKEAEEYMESDIDVINDNQVLWLLKSKDRKGYLDYMSGIIYKIENNPVNLEQFKKEIINIFLTAMKDNGVASKALFENSTVIRADRGSVDSNSSLLKYAEALMDGFEEVMLQVVDSNDIITRAKKYIDENYRNNIDREDVAAAAFVTPNYLSKQFRIKMNTNMREYINRLRIEEAQRLLLTTSMSVSEVATYVGYDNISYFSTVFRKFTNKSPIDWRN